MRTPTIASNANPPTEPPTIAPTEVDDPELVDETGGEVVVCEPIPSPPRALAPLVVDGVDELMVVLG